MNYVRGNSILFYIFQCLVVLSLEICSSALLAAELRDYSLPSDNSRRGRRGNSGELRDYSLPSETSRDRPTAHDPQAEYEAQFKDALPSFSISEMNELKSKYLDRIQLGKAVGFFEHLVTLIESEKERRSKALASKKSKKKKKHDLDPSQFVKTSPPTNKEDPRINNQKGPKEVEKSEKRSSPDARNAVAK